MQFRLNFDDNINSDLIGKIRERAKSGSLNKALQTMIVEWFALEVSRNTPKVGQVTDVIGQNQPDKDDLSAALDDLAADWDE